MKNDILPRWAMYFLAVVTAVVGLASSAITAKLFILGLERLETDGVARDILIAFGVLVIIVELLCFGLASLFPGDRFRSIRTKLIICGVLLLGFEAVTIYVTQAALIKTSDVSASANLSRIADLRQSVLARRAAAQSLRENGASQTASKSSWVRHLGTKALAESLETEKSIDVLTAELATLESASRPTMTTVLGENGVLFYSVARAMLISMMGLVMFATAGALCRAAASDVSPVVPPSAVLSPVFQESASIVPTVALIESESVAVAGRVVASAALVTDLGRYQTVKSALTAGVLLPSVKAIVGAYGWSVKLATRYLRKLEKEGVTIKNGVDWVLKSFAAKDLMNSRYARI